MIEVFMQNTYVKEVYVMFDKYGRLRLATKGFCKNVMPASHLVKSSEK